MEFITERLILRPWRESDADSLYEYAKDPSVGPAAGWPAHTGREHSLTVIRNVLTVDESYAVCMKEDNRAIGSISLFRTARSHTQTDNTEWEIGFWLGAPFWGRGYIPEAVRTLQRHAFVDLGCTALWCACFEGNEKSRRCQEKCGFIFHHTEENKKCAQLGEVRREHRQLLTREKWQQGLPENI